MFSPRGASDAAALFQDISRGAWQPGAVRGSRGPDGLGFQGIAGAAAHAGGVVPAGCCQPSLAAGCEPRGPRPGAAILAQADKVRFGAAVAGRRGHCAGRNGFRGDAGGFGPCKAGAFPLAPRQRRVCRRSRRRPEALGSQAAAQAGLALALAVARPCLRNRLGGRGLRLSRCPPSHQEFGAA